MSKRRKYKKVKQEDLDSDEDSIKEKAKPTDKPKSHKSFPTKFP